MKAQARFEEQAQRLAALISGMRPGQRAALCHEEIADIPQRSLFDTRPGIERLKDMVIGGRTEEYDWRETYTPPGYVVERRDV